MSAIDKITIMDPASATSLPTMSLTQTIQTIQPAGGVAMGKGGANKEKCKVVRRDQEKRRQQNLQAQKKYREKLRKRLDDLEILAASVAKTRETGTAKVVVGPAAAPVTPISDQTSSPDETPPDWSSSSHCDENPKDLCQRAEGPSTVPLDVFAPTAVQETSMDWLFWDSATSIDPSYLTMTNYRKADPEKEFWPTTYVHCGCAVRHVEVRTRSPGRHGSGVELLRVGESKVFSDPYLNHIRMEAVCTISAMWENCLQLGVSEWVLCDDESQSPFYRPGPSNDLITSGTTEAADGVVSTVQRIWKTLKPDIRPIKEQVTVPHHPCLDIFPFPTFRRNVLRGVVVIDEDEFFCDALSGLTCWGGAGLGRGDRKAATGKASTGTPWDHRSWEAKPWFIRKYWIVLGGEDGELVRQSEWWRNTRGEDVDIWASEASGAVSNWHKTYWTQQV